MLDVMLRLILRVQVGDEYQIAMGIAIVICVGNSKSPCNSVTKTNDKASYTRDCHRNRIMGKVDAIVTVLLKGIAIGMVIVDQQQQQKQK